MPKIRKKSFSFKEGYREFEIWYNSKDGFYLKDFPEEMVRIVGETDRLFIGFHPTETDLISKHETVIRRYYEIVQTEDHVIVIKLRLSPHLTMIRTPHGYSGTQEWAKDIFNKLGSNNHGLRHAIGFEYETGIVLRGKQDRFFKTTQDAEGNILTREKHGTSFNEDSDFTTLPYSIEAEVFLANIADHMSTLAQKMALFLAKKENLLLAIQEKKLLLDKNI